MPRIKTHNISSNIVKKAAKGIIDEISELLRTDRSNVTIQVCEDKFVSDGEFIQSHPYVELSLLTRPQDLEDQMASIITDQLMKSGCESVDLYIIHLEKRQYYENAKPLN